jgi:nicotinate phosphoribosyltransferase
VIPSKVERLYDCVWRDGVVPSDYPTTMKQVRENLQRSLESLRQDHKRSLNPTPYKVSEFAS